MSWCVFAYDFLHRKSQDMLLRLVHHRVAVSCVLGAEWTPLRPMGATLRTKVLGDDRSLLHPKAICERFAIPYEAVAHESAACAATLGRYGPRFGLIAGARILPRPIVDAFPGGILNFHPARLPDCPGLDSLIWSVYRDIRPGVSAHLVDHRVDAGWLLAVAGIAVHADDTLFDLSERLYQAQLRLLPVVVAALERAPNRIGVPIVRSKAALHGPTTAEIERAALDRLPEYLAHWAGQTPDVEWHLETLAPGVRA